MSNNDLQPTVSPLKIQSRLSLKRTSFQASSPDDEQASSSGSSSVASLSSRTKLCELTETTVQNNLIVEGRILSKTIITVFNSSQLFSCVLSDDTSVIRVVVWSLAFCNLFYHQIEVGKLYKISKFLVRKSLNINYTWVKNPIHISLNGFSKLTLLDETISSYRLPIQTMKFTPFHSCKEVGRSCINLIGAVYEIGEEVTINSVRKSVKREITLIDGLDFKAVITMWGDTANNFVKNCGSLAEDVIVAFGGLQLSTFPRPNSSDIYMDSFDDSIIIMNPDVPEVEAIRNWLKTVESLFE